MSQEIYLKRKAADGRGYKSRVVHKTKTGRRWVMNTWGTGRYYLPKGKHYKHC